MFHRNAVQGAGAFMAVLLVSMVVAFDAAADAPKGASRSDAAEETREALGAYREALEDELRTLEQGIEKLEDKAKAAVADARPETKERLRKLREEHAAAQKKLDELGEEANRVWEGIKARMDRIVDDLKRDHESASKTL